jgi:hypothetical protein
VCKRLLRDPAVDRAQAKLRAQALEELGRIFLEVIGGGGGRLEGWFRCEL